MSNVLAQLISISAYVEQRPQVFPSLHSFLWYMRKHRAALIQRGAVLKPNGRWLVNPTACDEFILQAQCRRQDGTASTA